MCACIGSEPVVSPCLHKVSFANFKIVAAALGDITHAYDGLTANSRLRSERLDDRESCLELVRGPHSLRRQDFPNEHHVVLESPLQRWGSANASGDGARDNAHKQRSRDQKQAHGFRLICQRQLVYVTAPNGRPGSVVSGCMRIETFKLALLRGLVPPRVMYSLSTTPF